MTNLQRFVEFYKNESGIEQFILDNFDNQDSSTFELNGKLYYILTEFELNALIEAYYKGMTSFGCISEIILDYVYIQNFNIVLSGM